MSFDESLRHFLESFVLKGEAQQIGRVMEYYSQIYFEQQSSTWPIKSKDAAFILSYSIIQLNTVVCLHSNKTVGY